MGNGDDGARRLTKPPNVAEVAVVGATIWSSEAKVGWCGGGEDIGTRGRMTMTPAASKRRGIMPLFIEI